MDFIHSQKALVYILKIFGFFGYRPNKYGIHGSFLDIAYNLIVTFSFQYFFITSEDAKRMRQKDKDKGNISELIDFLNFLSTVAYMFIINISMIIKKNSQIDFFGKLSEIEMKIDPNGSTTFNKFLQRKSFAYILQIVVHIATLPLIHVLVFKKTFDEIISSLGNFLFMASFLSFIWVFMIILIKRLIGLIKKLNENLNNEKYSEEKLESSIMFYNELCDLTREFNDEFGIACLVSYLMVFVSISIYSYNFVAVFIEMDNQHPNLLPSFVSMIWIWSLTIIFLEFSFLCEIYNNEV
jgi:hypothetical protein